MIAYAPFVTINNSLLRREKLLVHSPMLCATHIFQVLQNWLHLSIVQTSLALHSVCTIFRVARLFLSRMGKETSEGGKGEDLDILSASSLARKRSNQDFMCRAHFPFEIFFRRSGFCLNNIFLLLGSEMAVLMLSILAGRAVATAATAKKEVACRLHTTSILSVVTAPEAL